MDVTRYYQPREKLQMKGAEALSFVELMQIIIGSGSTKASAASIARQIEVLWKEKTIGYQTLLSLEGVGHAKACLILAVAEIAKRGTDDE